MIDFIDGDDDTIVAFFGEELDHGRFFFAGLSRGVDDIEDQIHLCERL